MVIPALTVAAARLQQRTWDVNSSISAQTAGIMTLLASPREQLRAMIRGYLGVQIGC